MTFCCSSESNTATTGQDGDGENDTTKGRKNGRKINTTQDGSQGKKGKLRPTRGVDEGRVELLG